jgi:uncharacterized membrane protein YkvA (DUF1232 family)
MGSIGGAFGWLRDKARQLKREVLVLYFAVRDPRTPLAAKLFTALVVAYALSPIDLIPDFIPVLGYLDDLVLVPLGIAIALRMIPQDVLDASRVRADQLLVRPRNWFAAALIVLVWIASAAAVGWWIASP